MSLPLVSSKLTWPATNGAAIVSNRSFPLVFRSISLLQIRTSLRKLPQSFISIIPRTCKSSYARSLRARYGEVCGRGLFGVGCGSRKAQQTGNHRESPNEENDPAFNKISSCHLINTSHPYSHVNLEQGEFSTSPHYDTFHSPQTCITRQSAPAKTKPQHPTTPTSDKSPKARNPIFRTGPPRKRPFKNRASARRLPARNVHPHLQAARPREPAPDPSLCAPKDRAPRDSKNPPPQIAQKGYDSRRSRNPRNAG